jgi:hypothetical protein
VGGDPQERAVLRAVQRQRQSLFVTPKAGEKVDKHRLMQVGRAMKELGVQMIPPYSPQARGRGERNFGTWQGRLPTGVASGRDHGNGGGKPLHLLNGKHPKPLRQAEGERQDKSVETGQITCE